MGGFEGVADGEARPLPSSTSSFVRTWPRSTLAMNSVDESRDEITFDEILLALMS